MGGFANAVVGGMSKLIRAAIQSPNFLTGVSGWTINKDGTAEFNNLSIRGTVAMVPIAQGTLGNLYWLDGFTHPAQIYEDVGLNALILRPPSTGNVYTKVFLWNDGAFNGRAWIFAWKDAGAGAGSVRATSAIGEHGLEVTPTDNIGGGQSTISIGRQSGIDTVKFRIGYLADVGAYYAESWTIATGSNYPNGSLQPVIGSTALALVASTSQNEYGGTPMVLATGVWTCPENGWYTLTIMLFLNLGLAAFQLILAFIDGAANRVLLTDVQTVSGDVCLSGRVWIAAGTTLTPSVFQVSGAARTVSAAAGLRSFVSITREAA